MSPLDRAATEAMIAGQLVAMSDDDLAIVSHALAFGAPSALAAGGPAPEYDRKREYGTAVLDPRPDARSVVAGAILAAYRLVADRIGRRLP